MTASGRLREIRETGTGIHSSRELCPDRDNSFLRRSMNAVVFGNSVLSADTSGSVAKKRTTGRQADAIAIERIRTTGLAFRREVSAGPSGAASNSRLWILKPGTRLLSIPGRRRWSVAASALLRPLLPRSEERRVGKECRS